MLMNLRFHLWHLANALFIHLWQLADDPEQVT